jgi:plasmid stabilization system protein ParE
MLLVVHPAAERELAQALSWTRKSFGAGAALRLQRRVSDVGDLLLREPGLGTPAAAGTLRFALAGYPYSLVYKAQADVVHVLAFMHQSRMPDYWMHRA